MLSGHPSISVVMSVFNGQAFLSEAIESILSQTFRNFEFLVIDDGSTDRTAEILADYASRDVRIRVMRHGNKGRTASLNIGINLAAGKYIARMDADDVALPDRLRDQVEFLEQHPEVGLLGGAVELINRQGKVIQTTRPPLEDEEIKSVMLGYNPMCHPAVMMRKEAAIGAGGYREAFSESEDYDLWLRMSERCQLANLGKPILQYRVHSGQASMRNLEEQTLCLLAALAAAKLRRCGSPDPLLDADKITPQLLDTLGVTRAEIQETLLAAYGYWAEILEPTDPEASLRVIEVILQLPGVEGFDRSAIANTWLKAASIHYRQGRRGKAVAAATRAVLVRPIIAGRPVKWACTRLANALKG
jgi:hypothetical protein